MAKSRTNKKQIQTHGKYNIRQCISNIFKGYRKITPAVLILMI
jgi:hypothetical protein